MPIDRRRMLGWLTATAAAPFLPIHRLAPVQAKPTRKQPLRTRGGPLDWAGVRALFPLSEEWTHLASFLLVSHPKPAASCGRQRERNAVRAKAGTSPSGA
jgi:hypothetical protein